MTQLGSVRRLIAGLWLAGHCNDNDSMNTLSDQAGAHACCCIDTQALPRMPLTAALHLQGAS